MDRFVGSALDSSPWGAVHVAVAVALVLVVSALLVTAVMVVVSQLAKLRAVAVAVEPVEPLVVPAVE